MTAYAEDGVQHPRERAGPVGAANDVRLFLKGINAKRPSQYQFQLAHSYQFLAPPKEHYAEHPEWYSLVKGRRLGTNEWCRLFRDCGVRWLFAHGCDGGAHADMAELKTYLESKLMWNPDRDATELTDQFLNGFYGPAAPFVRQYLDNLHATLRMTRDPEPYAAPAAVGLYGENLPVSDEFLEKAIGTWLKAEAAASADPVRRFNARVGTLPMLYTRLKRRYEESRKKVWCAEDLEPHIAAYQRLQPLAADFVARADEIIKGVEGVKGRDGFTLSEGYSTYQRLMGEFRSLAAWTAPTSGCDRAEVEEKAMSVSKRERTWRLPLRLIACDTGATYRVRAHLKARGEIEAGTEVPGLPFAAGHSRKTMAPAPSGDWDWYDIGEYDIVGLQNLPRPTRDGPAFFVRGDIDFDRLEIAKVK